MASPLTKELTPGEVGAIPEGQRSASATHHVVFRKLFDRHAPLVWRALRHLGVREADVADQCQEVFLVVFRRYDSFE